VTAMGYLEIQHFPLLGDTEGTFLLLELHFGYQMPCGLQLRRKQYKLMFIKTSTARLSNLQIQHLIKEMLPLFKYIIRCHNTL
jgi:hypothetical protein